MLRIRFARKGKKNHATYRVIVSERTRDTQGRYLELLGNVNPHTDPPTVVLNAERIQYWISKGAKASDTVHNLLVEQKVIEGKKIATGSPRKKKSSSEGAPDGESASEDKEAPAGENGSPPAEHAGASGGEDGKGGEGAEEQEAEVKSEASEAAKEGEPKEEKPQPAEEHGQQ